MIKGILLGLSIATFIVSIFISISGITGALQENIITGAAIGSEGAVSYALITAVLSFVAICFFLILIKNPKNPS